MQTRMLGNTGLAVSPLGFGASPLGGVFGDLDEPEAIATVHAAVDAGINYIDVAPYYGLTRAETVLGKALQALPRDRYLLSSKVGRYGAEEFDFSAGRVVRSVDESLQRLHVDHLDLALCHDIEFVDLNQVINEALPALETLRQQGKVRFLGVSGLPLRSLDIVAERYPLDFVLSYCHYTLLDATLANWLPVFASRGLGVINASPLSMGLLAEAEPPPWHPAPPELRRAVAEIKAYCRDRGVDLTALALQFSLDHPGIATTLVGMVDREQLRRNLAALGNPPDAEHVEAIRVILGAMRDLSWPSGRPENS